MTFHLVASLMTPGHFRAAWRLPHNDPRAHTSVDHFERLARTADEAGIDAIFLGDAPVLSEDIASHPANGIDPLVLLGHLGALTQRVGVLVTSSTTYNSPYNLARRFQALDIVTRGRAAVNLVTTYAPRASANFGLDVPLAKADRYRRAHEFLTVVQGLWDGWEPDAVLADQSGGRYADTERIRGVDHVGEFFSVAGPLPTPAGPQGRPVVVQAGGSEGGLRLGSELADVIFTVAQTQRGAVAFRDDVRTRAVAAGRSADDVKVSLGVIVLVGETEDDARERAASLQATVPVDDVARATLALLGLPDRDLDEPIGVDDLPPAPVDAGGPAGFRASTVELLRDRPLSARDLVGVTAGVVGGGHRLVVGTAEQVADDLEDWWRAGAADGFTIMYADTSVDFDRFAHGVVPRLIERGLFVPADVGTTLRERLGLPWPHAAGRTPTAASATGA